eukprot:600501-Pelagomonas_calceolata.AAC.1
MPHFMPRFLDCSFLGGQQFRAKCLDPWTTVTAPPVLRLMNQSTIDQALVVLLYILHTAPDGSVHNQRNVGRHWHLSNAHPSLSVRAYMQMDQCAINAMLAVQKFCCISILVCSCTMAQPVIATFQHAPSLLSVSVPMQMDQCTINAMLAVLFCCIFILVCSYIMVQLVIGIILDNIQAATVMENTTVGQLTIGIILDIIQRPPTWRNFDMNVWASANVGSPEKAPQSKTAVGQDDVNEFIAAWEDLDPFGTSYIHVKQLTILLSQLPAGVPCPHSVSPAVILKYGFRLSKWERGAYPARSWSMDLAPF